MFINNINTFITEEVQEDGVEGDDEGCEEDNNEDRPEGHPGEHRLLFVPNIRRVHRHRREINQDKLSLGDGRNDVILVLDVRVEIDIYKKGEHSSQ